MKRLSAVLVFLFLLCLQIPSYLAAQEPFLSGSTAFLMIGDTKVGAVSQATFTLSNTGGGNLSIKGITVSGRDSAQFKVSPTTATLAAGQRLTVTVTFTPTSAGVKLASFSIAHNAAGSPAEVLVRGIGVVRKVGPDFDDDGSVDSRDFYIFADGYGAVKGDARFDSDRDLNKDGRVDGVDFFLLAQNFGKNASNITLTPFSSPGPNARAAFSATLDRATGVQVGQQLFLTISAAGVSGVTGCIAEVLYDSNAVTMDWAESKLHFFLLNAVDTGKLPEGFNQRTETTGSQLPPNSFAGAAGNADIITFRFTTKPGFTTANFGIRRLVVVTGSKIDTLTASPAPLVIKVNSGGSGAIPKSPDFDGDSEIGFGDFFIFATDFGGASPTGRLPADLNGDGRVDAMDLFLLAQNFGKKKGDPDWDKIVPLTSPGPNSGAKLSAKLDRLSGVVSGDKVALTVSVTGVNGLTGYAAEVLYDSVAVADPMTTAKLRSSSSGGSAFSPGRISEVITTVTGFNKRTETAGSQLPYNPFNGDVDISVFEFTARPGFIKANIGIRRLILVAGSKIDTIAVSPPLVLQVNPVPPLALSVSSLTLDDAKVGATSEKTFTISNKGTGTLSVTGITVGGADAGQFRVSPTTAMIAAGGSQTVTITFTPTSAATSSATLSIAYNAVGSPATVALIGTGVPAGPLVPRVGDGTGTLVVGEKKTKVLGNIKPGQKAVVTVLFNQEVAFATGFRVVLKFDPKKLAVLSGKGDGVFATAIFPGPPQVKDNTVTYAGAFLGQSTTAKGPVAVLIFQALPDFSGETQTEIVLTNITIRAGSDKDFTPQASVVIGSGAVAGGLPTSDFNNDGQVDFDDFFLFAAAFGSTDAQFDLDGDGQVGFDDFFVFAGDFGQKAGKPAALTLDLMEKARRVLIQNPAAWPLFDYVWPGRFPTKWGLGQNFPNPFNPATTIQYDLAEDSYVELRIYNILGQIVRTLINERQTAGPNWARWNGKDDQGQLVASGSYFYRLTAGSFMETRQMMFIK